MRPLGLHVAIAAWIDQRRGYDGFAVVPASPVQFSPTAMLPLAESLDEARLAELARMANVVPRKGQLAEPFGPSPPLWERMVDVLDRMVFARRALTDAEAAVLDAARTVLYVSDDDDRPHPSPQFLSYLEMRSVVQALQDSGAATDVQQAALADWLTLGYKNEVEQALADLTRLGSRSSVVEAMSCRTQLHETMLPTAGEISYAPTAFYPLSAAHPATWTVAEVPLAELGSCAARSFPSSPVTFASASTATCRFAYAAIETLRPWPVTQLLSRDDWRLSSGEPVSAGDGVSGTVPGYVQTMYAAAVVGSGATPPPRPRWPPGQHWPDRPPFRTGGLPRPLPRRLPTMNGGVAGVRVRDGGATLGPGKSEGVQATRVVLRSLPELPSLGGMAQLNRDPALIRRFQVPLDRSEWLARLAIAGGVRPVAGGEAPTAPVEPAPMDLISAARIVGFGCATVPASPRPNPNYQW